MMGHLKVQGAIFLDDLLREMEYNIYNYAVV